MVTTKALVVAEAGASFLFQDIEIDDENLRDEDVLVEMTATGVCHTDINFSREKSIPGLFPAVFGHEGAGKVVKVGNKSSTLQPGDHVLMSYTSCGECRHCHSHATSFCNTWEERNFGVGRFDGSKAYQRGGEDVTSHFFGQSSMAHLAVVSEQSLVKVAKDLPLEILAPLGCGIMTGAGALLNVARLYDGCTVVVTGAGAVGLSSLMAVALASSRPAKIVAIDILPERLELAKRFGATHTINSKETPNLVQELNKLTEGEGLDAAIDTTGRPDVLRSLLDACGKKGMVISVGVGSLSADVSTNIFKTVNSGRTYVGCVMGNCYPPEFLPRLIDGWKAGKFPFDQLIQTYKAEECQKAVEDALAGKTVKAVLLWSGGG